MLKWRKKRENFTPLKLQIDNRLYLRWILYPDSIGNIEIKKEKEWNILFIIGIEL